MSSYRTVARAAEAEVEVRRSRFRCRVVRVDEEATARAVVEEERRRHFDARHHCSALVLGPRGEVERSSDDGEPAGTAGAPMLEVLRGRGLSDVVAVVTRWFGGTLLGAGGLVRAYSDAVRAALDQAGTRERRLVTVHQVTVPHGEAGRVEHALRAEGFAVLGVEYGARAVLRTAVPVPERERLPALLAALTGGAVEATPVGERWVDA